MRELAHPKTPEAAERWAQSPPTWLRISKSPAKISVEPTLDPGEAHALALAKELHASAVLIDEKKGRRIAKEQGFATLGTVTVLELAAQRNLLDLKSAFESRQRTSFQISAIYIEAALERETARRLARGKGSS